MITGKVWKTCATPEAVRIVVDVLKNARTDVPGLTTKQIFDAIHDKYPDAKQASFPSKVVPAIQTNRKSRQFSYTLDPRPPPLPEVETRDHPVRSIRYLKKFVLEEMALNRLVEKIHLDKGELPDDVRREITPKIAPRNKKAIKLISRPDAWLWKLLPLSEGEDPAANFKSIPPPERSPPPAFLRKERPERYRTYDDRRFPPSPRDSDVD
ncbi:hypothetical protein CERSUDRAFT_70792 [Gelatoporia subvermispora B]|uniref:Uncharacterized protein n=1 Tax=Ceriporiopsis subvermispora (strain B) TaxID=914234 RepID=M2RPR7_CERS8|nr:hypothetical protein CERSUDRAFT_70792 [Gelatoporia subvermispora B]